MSHKEGEVAMVRLPRVAGEPILLLPLGGSVRQKPLSVRREPSSVRRGPVGTSLKVMSNSPILSCAVFYLFGVDIGVVE